MTYDPDSSKHNAMRELLAYLGVDDPENPNYYSTGGTVRKDAIDATRRALEARLEEIENSQ